MHSDGSESSISSVSCKLLKSLQGLFWIAGAFSICLTFVAGLQIRNWLSDLCCHFFLQYSVIQAAVLLFAVLCRRWTFAFVVLLSLLFCLSQILPCFFQKQALAEGDVPRLSILQMNVNAVNDRYDLALDCIRQFNPDLVIFEELTPGWSKAMITALSHDYPYYEAAPRYDNFGIAFFSRLPLNKTAARRSSIVAMGNSKVPGITSVLRLRDKQVSVIAIHTLPPISLAGFDERNLILDQAQGLRGGDSAPFILVGDFNCTLWSPYLRDICEKMDLLNSRSGFGIQPTWPVQLPLMMIPIDNFLHSRKVITCRQQLGPAIGSDHLPVFAEFAFP